MVGTIQSSVPHRALPPCNGRVGSATVKDGRLDVPAMAERRCLRKQFFPGTAFVQPAGEVHDDRNEGSEPTTIYYVGISSSAGPFVVPQPLPPCSTRE